MQVMQDNVQNTCTRFSFKKKKREKDGNYPEQINLIKYVKDESRRFTDISSERTTNSSVLVDDQCIYTFSY